MYFPVFQGSLNIPRAVACFQQKMPTGLSFRTYAPRLIPVCYGHHWILVIDRTQLHISLMILDSLNREHRSIEVKITKYLQDVWSAKLPQSGKKTLELKQIRYPAVPPQPNNKGCGLYIMKCYEQFLDLVNRNLQWSSWNLEFSHQEVLSFPKEIKHTILDEISNKKNKGFKAASMFPNATTKCTKAPTSLLFFQECTS